MRDILSRIDAGCRRKGLATPSRATIYNLIDTMRSPALRCGDLPMPVQNALYNLEPASEVPPRQVAFYCFNYGDLAAVSFASGLPWLALHQARRLPGYRAKSRGLLEGVARARGI